MEQTSRLYLTAPITKDFQRFYEIYSDPETNRFNPFGPLDYDKAIAAFDKILRHWNEHKFGLWTVRVNQEIIGFGGLSYKMYATEKKLNLGYRFDKNYWGQGFATELSRYAIHFGFTNLKTDIIHAVVRPHHTASIKVLEKCGMQVSGTLDDVQGQPQSLVYMVESSRQ